MAERPPKRPAVLEGETTVKKTKCGNIYITVNYNEQGVLDEVFIRGGRPDDGDKIININPCCHHFMENMGKNITHHIRNRLELKRIIKQAESTTECYTGLCKFPDAKSCCPVIASVLKKYLTINEETSKIK